MAQELLRRQEDLERKASELDRREREMQSLSASGGGWGAGEATLTPRGRQWLRR